MPREKKSGRGRVDLKIHPDASDAVVEAAAMHGLDFSSYCRLAISEKLKRDGFTVKVTPEHGIGRPKGGGDAKMK